MKQFFICNQDEVESRLKTLSRSGTTNDGWTEYYVDKETNVNWLLTWFHSEYHGGGIPVLKRLPEPTMQELIDIAMTSTERNDIIGASLELAEREKYKKEDFRDQLISRLLSVDISNLSLFERERFKIIIYESDLYDATNRREIVGKYLTEIQNDANYYQSIAKQAKQVLTDIEHQSS